MRTKRGILFQLVLERAARQNPPKTLTASTGEQAPPNAVVLTGWESRDAFDAWIDTPERDRLTDSEVHRSVAYRPITRYEIAGGYFNLAALTSTLEQIKEAGP